MADYQGGGEDLFAGAAGKTKEQLYIEAKDILNSISNSPVAAAAVVGGVGGIPDYCNVAAGNYSPATSAGSPGSSRVAPRRPPRSKHDRPPYSPVQGQVRERAITWLVGFSTCFHLFSSYFHFSTKKTTPFSPVINFATVDSSQQVFDYFFFVSPLLTLSNLPFVSLEQVMSLHLLTQIFFPEKSYQKKKRKENFPN